MARALRLLGLICVTLLAGVPVPAEAWTTPGWSNHRKIHVQVANTSGQTVSVTADGYHCQRHKMDPIVVGSGGTGRTQFEWGFEALECGTTPFAVVTVAPQGSSKVACRLSAFVVMKGSTTFGSTPSHWRVFGDPYNNCTWGIAGPDGKIPPAQDNLFIKLKANPTLFDPPAPKGKYRSTQCRTLVKGYPPQCSWVGGGGGDDPCVTSDCRTCPDGNNYVFYYTWPGDTPMNNNGGCPAS
jgi:hypothetical protein